MPRSTFGAEIPAWRPAPMAAIGLEMLVRLARLLARQAVAEAMEISRSDISKTNPADDRASP